MLDQGPRKEVILSCTGLGSGYGGKPVLQGVNLEVREGEIVAVIGRNGVGKSTLMKTLIGLLPATSGEIIFKGQPIAAMPAHLRARLGIGYVPQGRDVFPRMSVEENLKVGASISGGAAPADYNRVYSLLPILAERRHQRAGTMSGGQQQQLAIGRVLVGKPGLILLDEPSEGIQPSIVEEIGRTMTQLNKQGGVTVVFVEQNVDLIRAMAQRCYVMDKGRIVEEAAPEDLNDRARIRRYLSV
jgi:branched-chain amino acid transport system ATP-binding protein